MTLTELRHLIGNVLPEWVHERLVQLLGLLCLGLDVFFGTVLVAAPRSEFKSPLWRMAEIVQPLQSWGLLVLVFAFVAILMWWVQGRCHLGAFWLTFMLGFFYWGFWTILTASASFGPNGATGVFAGFCAATSILHILTGLVWHVPVQRRLARR